MEIIKEFGINPILLLAQIVNFTILLLLLKKFLYKPILKVLEDRKSTVAKSLKQAEEIEKRLEQTALEQEKLLKSAAAESNKIISDSKKEAHELAEKTLEQTKQTINDMLEKNEARLKTEKDQMLIEVKKELTDLVVATTLKVSKKTFSKEDNKKIIDETIREAGK